MTPEEKEKQRERDSKLARAIVKKARRELKPLIREVDRREFTKKWAQPPHTGTPKKL